MDEVVLQSDQIDKVEEVNEVMDEKVLEDYGVGKVDELADEVIRQVDEIDKVYEVQYEVVHFIDDIDGVDEMVEEEVLHVDRQVDLKKNLFLTCLSLKFSSLQRGLLELYPTGLSSGVLMYRSVYTVS